MRKVKKNANLRKIETIIFRQSPSHDELISNCDRCQVIDAVSRKTSRYCSMDVES